MIATKKARLVSYLVLGGLDSLGQLLFHCGSVLFIGGLYMFEIEIDQNGTMD